MNQKQGGMQRFLVFMAGKGFYLVLVLCIMAIGVSGYMLFFRTADPAGDDLTLSNPTTVPSYTPVPTSNPLPSATPAPTVRPQPTQAAVVPTPPINTSKPVADLPVVGPADITDPEDEPTVKVTEPPKTDKSDETDKTDKSDKSDKENKTTFFWPVVGDVAGEYTGTEMVFNETMQDWRAHPGLDIKTEADARISAAANGQVTDIKDDPYYGTVITITHADGYVTRYGNLQKTVSVTIDQEVTAGDIIGTIGETTSMENTTTPHLHFELLQNQQQVNPLDVLPERA